ncbi:MAG: hypothetical protein LBL74_08580 [Bacteroidales bacterium]|jgi:MFS family permease|nr:hypothetical protein [Bacteroidales bacterium]
MIKYCKTLNRAWLNTILMTLIATLIAAVFVWQYSQGSVVSGKWRMYYSLIMMVAMVACLFFGNNMTAKTIRRLKDKELAEKLAGYKLAYHKRLRFFSLIGFLAVISMLLLSNMFYVLFAVLSLMLISVSRISSIKVKYELNLGENDIKQIDKMKF